MKKFTIFFVLVSLMASPSFAFDKKDKKNKEQKEEKKKERPIAEQRAAKKKAKEEKKNGTANGAGSTAEATATIAVAPAPAPQSDIVMVKTLTAKKPKKETADLQNTYWRLSEMNGKTIEPGSDEAYIKLTEKKSALEGNAGCNTIVGTFKVGRHDEIAFEFGTTKKMCANMSVEAYMVNALKNANHYDINGHHLMLYNDSMLLAIFEAKYAD